MSQTIRYAVFTKPWKDLTLTELARHIAEIGLDGVELPVRPGFQIEPENVARDLPEAVKVFADHGLTIESISGPTDEMTIAACGEAGVPMIRVCLMIGPEGYLASEAGFIREYEKLAPVLADHGVAIGVQNHCNNDVGSCLGIMRIISDFSPEQFWAVWDPAHNALSGEIPEQAIDICWSHLRMVNLKSAWWLRNNGPESARAEWRLEWTTGRQGIAPWPRVVEQLKQREWSGPICFSAEYSDHEAVDRALADDFEYAQELFAE